MNTPPTTHTTRGAGRARLIRRVAVIVATLIIGVVAIRAAGPQTEAVPTLQEPFLVKLKHPLRRSFSLHAEIAQVKGVAQSERLVIDRWFASEDGLILRMRASAYLDRRRKEAILRRLSSLPAVELATTGSASVGQLQPALFVKAFGSDLLKSLSRGCVAFGISTKPRMKCASTPMRRTPEACSSSRPRTKRSSGQRARRHVRQQRPTTRGLEIA